MPNKTLVEDDDDDDYALFVKDGAPIKFCFHQSVTQGRGQITRDVERHGGQIVSDERRANVLLVDEEQDIEFLRRMYYSSTEAYRLSLYVEPRGFVQVCLRAGKYRHIGPTKKGMTGRRATDGKGARTRVAFTEEDREHLAYYLATLFPTRDGRMGNKAYKDLEKLGQTDDPSWEWARRHTWSSWREHYKTRPDMMDARIDRHLRALKDTGHHLGQDPRSRGDRDARGEEDEEDDENDENDEEEAERQRRRQRQRQRQRQQAERQGDRERQRADRPVAAAPRRPVETARKKGPPVSDDSDDNVQDEEDEESPQRVKRHRVRSDASQQDELPGSPARRARLPEASSSQGRVPRVELEQEESEERQRQRTENRERVQGARPTTVVQQRPPETAREYPARRDKDPLVGDEDEEDEERSQPVKRHYSQSDANRQQESPNSPAKRARVTEASSSSQRPTSGVGADRGNSDSNDEEDSDTEKSLEIEDSDLFGDREYGSQTESDENSGDDLFGDREYRSQPNVHDARDFDFPMRVSPQPPTRPVLEQDGLPTSTQETLVPSSPFVEKVLIPTPTKVAEVPVAQVVMTSPPSSQRTLVVSQERVVVQRARVRGASVQPGPSVPKEARTRGVAVVSDAPYRNTRGRSRSVEPQPHFEADSQPARQQGDQSGKGQKKGKERAKEVLTPIEEDMDVEEEEYDEEAVRQLPGSNSLTTQDEMSVEALLETEMSQKDEEDEESDEDIMSDLPRFQEVEIEGEPSDSDDVETHETLVRGSVQQEFSAGEEEAGSSQDRDKDDAARVEQRASGSLLNHAIRVTRSMAASQEISPRRTRSGSQVSRAPPEFPSPGTRARAVVDRFREDERKMPYVPPVGSRAAKGKGKER